MTDTRTRAFARLHRAVVLRSSLLPGIHADALTGARINVLGRSERPPVHSSGAFHAYPFGMPDVPR